VAPGTYTVTASRGAYVTSIPDGTFVVSTGLAVSGAQGGITFAAKTVALTGKLTLDGAPPARDVMCSNTYGLVRLDFRDSNGASFSSSVPCSASDGSFSATVAPGTYTVTASRGAYVTSVPDGTFVVSTGLAVSGAQSGITFAAKTVALTGTLTLDGAPPLRDVMCSNTYGLVRLDFSDSNGASFSSYVPCSASDGSFSATVAPGTYTVTASRGAYVTSVPDGTFLVSSSLAVSAQQSGLTLDVKTVNIAGHVTLDGAALPGDSMCSSTYGLVEIHLRGADNRPEPGILGQLGFSIGTSFSTSVACSATDGAFTVRLGAGTYWISANRGAYVTSIPDGTFDLVDRIALP
jgi:hypothetical protein